MTIPPGSPVAIDEPTIPPTPARRFGHVALEWGVVLLTLFPVCRFLYPLSASYYIDWGNHEWVIGYVGEYFHQRRTMPIVYNTTPLVGVADPIFYGTLLYPLLGLVSSVVAPGVTMRLAAVALWLAQYVLVSRALVQMNAPRYVAHLVAILVVWAIYPLTNFYNRGALTEFIATGLIVCALSLLFLLIQTDDPRCRRHYASGLCFSLTLAAGSHPITAVYGGAVFLVLAIVFFVALQSDVPRRAAILRATWAPIVAGLFCLLPWVVAVVRFGGALNIRHMYVGPDGLPTVFIYADHIDHWLTRFWPLPWDRRVTPGVNLESMATPYLDSQINSPLLVVFLALAAIAIPVWRRSRDIGVVLAIALPGILFGFFTWLSLSPASHAFLPASARMIQFAYRAVTYQNLSLLLGVFMVVMTLGRVRSSAPNGLWRRPALVVVLFASLMLSTIGVWIKGQHILAVQGHGSGPHLTLDGAERRRLAEMPGLYYGWIGYVTPRLFPPWREDGAPVIARNFEVDPDFDFGKVSAMGLQLPAPTWVLTNVLTFPWSVFTIDGAVVPPAALRARQDKTAVLVPAGSHTLAVGFQPDVTWGWLRTLSLAVLAGWSLMLLWRLVPGSFRCRSSSEAI
jgi:hypothetical protein